jgi:hypothetical protein
VRSWHAQTVRLVAPSCLTVAGFPPTSCRREFREPFGRRQAGRRARPVPLAELPRVIDNREGNDGVRCCVRCRCCTPSLPSSGVNKVGSVMGCGRPLDCYRRGGRGRNRDPRETASAGAHAWHDLAMATRGGTRLLIATGEAAASGEELPRLVRALIDSASEVFVVTPVLVSRLQWLASDTDRARYEADERLLTVLGQVDTLAPEATVRGRIGDDTPLTAFSDAIREFSPDHILIALRSSDHSGWQERGLLDQIRGFGIPITVFELDRAGRPPIRP